MSKNFAAGSSTGQIALRNIAQKSLAFSSSLSETSPRVQSLHRDVLRAVPWTKRTFSLPYTEQRMRQLLSQRFREKRDLKDLHIINRLIALGRMELEETLMLWKGESHVKNLFDQMIANEEAASTKVEDKFMESFLNNKS